jgi:hypothetical protein
MSHSALAPRSSSASPGSEPRVEVSAARPVDHALDHSLDHSLDHALDRALDRPLAPRLEDPRFAARAAIALSVVAMVLLAAMVAITAVTGVSQEEFEVLRPDYAAAIGAAAPTLRVVVALDTLFLLCYAPQFALLVQALGVAAAPMARLGVRLMLAVAVLDMIEDQHLLAMARAAEAALAHGGALGAGLDETTLRLQQVLSQTKFLVSYLALGAIALGLPRTTARERRLAWLIGVPLALLGALQWAAPPLEAALNVGRWIGFFGGFAAAIATLAPRAAAPAPARGAGATGAPA